jgi:hypothetical protein
VAELAELAVLLAISIALIIGFIFRRSHQFAQ